MTAAAILLTLAALGGSYVATWPVRQRRLPPAWLVLGHAAIALTGLALLAYHVVRVSDGTWPQFVLGAVVLTALGGLTMGITFHARGRVPPSWMVLGHGALGCLSVMLLWSLIVVSAS